MWNTPPSEAEATKLKDADDKRVIDYIEALAEFAVLEARNRNLDPTEAVTGIILYAGRTLSKSLRMVLPHRQEAFVDQMLWDIRKMCLEKSK